MGVGERQRQRERDRERERGEIKHDTGLFVLLLYVCFCYLVTSLYSQPTKTQRGYSTGRRVESEVSTSGVSEIAQL